MMKVFLVEDEVLMRNGIKNNIPWEKEGFEFVGEASDGELAYPLIKEKKPDILITDIRMPFMDGLELSRLIRKEMPNIKIIILSGYNEFDYAKTAISLGVTDYLLKPISSAKLLEAVKKVAVLVEEEQEHQRMLERFQTEMGVNILMEKHQLWNNLVNKRLSTVELLEQGQKLGMDFTASAYYVFLFKVMQEGDSERLFPQVLEVSNKITAMADQWDSVLTFDRSPEGWAFLIKGMSDEDARDRLDSCKQDLLELLENYQEVEYFGGIGTIAHRLGEIRHSYKNAAKAFTGRFFDESSKLIEYSENVNGIPAASEKIDVSRIRSKKLEYELIDRFLKRGTGEEIDSFLDEFFLEMGEENFRSLLYRQYMLMNLYFSVTDFLNGMNKGTDQLPEAYRDINQIVERFSRDTGSEPVREFIRDLFAETIRVRDHQSKKKYNALLEEAKAYIAENYQREDMSLNTVAAKVNISPSYFSAIFSGEMNVTFVEYLTSVRMEKAKELLMCTTMRTAEIGYEVGYKEPHYFSYIFKKMVGCSPKEYKNRGKEQV